MRGASCEWRGGVGWWWFRSASGRARD